MDSILVLDLHRHVTSDLGTLNVANLRADEVITEAYRSVLEGENPKASNLVKHNPNSHEEYVTDISIVQACLGRSVLYFESRGYVPPPEIKVLSYKCKAGRLLLQVEK